MSRVKSIIRFSMFVGLLIMHAAKAAETTGMDVVVDAPFVELHTGPGEGYPTFHVAERGEILHMEKRKLDWIKVKAKRDVHGWMSLGEAGKTVLVNSQIPFATVLSDELNNQRYGVGLSTGAFEQDAMFSLDVKYRIFSGFGAELGYSKVIGRYSSSNIFSGGLRFSFFPFGKFAPYLKAGLGGLSNTPRSLLVGGEQTTSSVLFAGGGLQYRVQRNLAVFGDLSVYGLSDVVGNQTQYSAVQAGIRALF